MSEIQINDEWVVHSCIFHTSFPLNATFPLLGHSFQTYKPNNEFEQEDLDEKYDIYNECNRIIENLSSYNENDTINALRYIFSENIMEESSIKNIFKVFKEASDKSPEFLDYFINNGIFPDKKNETMVDFFQVLRDGFDIPNDTYLYVEDNEIFAKYIYSSDFEGEKLEKPVSILKIDRNDLWNLTTVNYENITTLQNEESKECKYFEDLEKNKNKDVAAGITD